MFRRLGEFIAKSWPLVILAWLVTLLAVRQLAPNWDDVTYDGDLAYLPDDQASIRAEKMLAEAFPENRAKSQVCFVIARMDRKLTPNDLAIADRLAVPFHNYRGAYAIKRAEKLRDEYARFSEECRPILNRSTKKNTWRTRKNIYSPSTPSGSINHLMLGQVFRFCEWTARIFMT